MIEFIRELNRNYLSIVHEDEREPDYTMKMVENNSISGLLSLRKSVVIGRAICMIFLDVFHWKKNI